MKQLPCVNLNKKQMKRGRRDDPYFGYDPEKAKWKDEDDVVYCAHFGCGVKLTLEEKLCGNKCIAHQGNKKVDVVKFLKFK